VILGGRHAGKKGIIVKSNYENTKDRRYPHCLVVGLNKAPRRVTKKSIKRLDERQKRIEKVLSESKDNQSAQENLNRLKRLGVFVKSYNMSHLLATRYKVEEDFGIQTSIEKLDKIESDIKEKQSSVNKKEHEKSDDTKEAESLRKELGGLKDKYKQSLREVKSSIGTELFNRFNRGFVRARDANQEENEKIAHSEFLFKKLKF
jgi:large subunit ribosomal protein L27e